MEHQSDADSYRYDFWRRWLFGVCLLFAAFGVAIALAGDSVLLAPWNAAACRLFWNSAAVSPEVQPFKKLLFGIIGGTMTCSYVLLAFIAAVPMRQRERWALHAATWSLVAWFVLDSGVSLSVGAFFNVWMINLFALLVKGLPLVFMWRRLKAN